MEWELAEGHMISGSCTEETRQGLVWSPPLTPPWYLVVLRPKTAKCDVSTVFSTADYRHFYVLASPNQRTIWPPRTHWLTDNIVLLNFSGMANCCKSLTLQVWSLCQLTKADSTARLDIKAFLGVIRGLALFVALSIHNDLSYLLYMQNVQWKQSHSFLDA